ncbi:DegT/DnrJ/EryC1/StrS family aminotransferase [Mycobacterium sp. OTB74]|uniref:DegT/DnrJ/EryC1/StrS family aminotransferase n=1 Tax=Mycobacterium sp. OTB74 TaxID=1853452 RepID=UPI002476065A|nr:DegT/DnrJ/EryC1/StrS family aminotransferase [Mycobacterium sp. OTB74]
MQQISPRFDGDEEDEVLRSIRAGWLTEGPQAAEFLDRILAETGARHAVLAPNGTLGLFLALLALDLPRDSEILIPAFTFYASATAALFAGLRPVFVDVDPQTFNVDVAGLENAITERTTAIMPVHIYGHCAPMDTIMEFASDRGLAVIEDAAQAYSVTYRGRHAGTWGNLGAISFFADKTVTTGEGGVVLTDDDKLYDRLRLLRNQGRFNSGTFIHDGLGMNFRVTDLQCAVGNAQLRKLPDIVAAKRANHDRYVANLAGVQGVRWLQVQPGSDHVPFRFALVSERRDDVVAALEQAGVQTRSFFYPLHLQPALRPYARGGLPVSESLYEQGVCLPVHPDLTSAQIDEISAIIHDVHEGT